jgi:hypothetical protein
LISQYELKIKSGCPEDNGRDDYQLIIRSFRPVPVEIILDAVRKYESRLIFQENITAELARDLGAEVTTIGYHSGVKTTCCAGLP